VQRLDRSIFSGAWRQRARFQCRGRGWSKWKTGNSGRNSLTVGDGDDRDVAVYREDGFRISNKDADRDRVVPKMEYCMALSSSAVKSSMISMAVATEDKTLVLEKDRNLHAGKRCFQRANISSMSGPTPTRATWMATSPASKPRRGKQARGQLTEQAGLSLMSATSSACPGESRPISTRSRSRRRGCGEAGFCRRVPAIEHGGAELLSGALVSMRLSLARRGNDRK